MASDTPQPAAQSRYNRVPISFTDLDSSGVTKWGNQDSLHTPTIEINQNLRNSPILQTAIAHEIAHSLLQHPTVDRRTQSTYLSNPVGYSDVLHNIPLMRQLLGFQTSPSKMQSPAEILSAIDPSEITPSLLFRYGYGLQNLPPQTLNTLSQAASDAVQNSPSVSSSVKNTLLQMYQNHLKPPL